MRAIIYLRPDCLDQEVQKGVTRGVYLMQCREDPRLLRYGQIGAGGKLDDEPSDSNNAHQRLKQVRATWRLDNARRAAAFDFVLLCHLQNCPKRVIKETETAIKLAMRTSASTWGSAFGNAGSTVLRYKDGLEVLAAPHDAFLLTTQDDVDSVASLIGETIAKHLASCSNPVVVARGRQP